MANRDRAYNRKMSYKKALRKRNITEQIYWDGNGPYYHPYYNNLHQYSKNKIHCSCPMCSAKTKRRKSARDWGPGRYNYTHSDLIKQQRLDSSLEDFYNEQKLQEDSSEWRS